MSYQHVIISGNVIDGVTLVGPFDDPSTAHDYAREECNDEWSVGPIYTPVDVAPSAECDDLREQFDNLKEHYAKLSHRNDELDAARASLLRSEIKRWTEIQELRAEVEDQRTKYHALAMHSNKVCDERDELHADYNLSRADSLRLNAENQTLADERDELKAKNRQLHRNYQNADHDYCATASQNEELHAELEALRASTIESDLTTEIEKLSAENRELSSIVTNQQRAMIDLHAEIEALKDERDGAVHTYTTVANERDTLEDECNDLAVERDELRAERVTLWNEREELKAKYEDLKARCTQPFFEGIVGERNELRRKYDALHAELEAQNDYVAWLQGRIKSMTTKRSDS
jgi:uncharacterized coiled-coil DUF342 family protein